MVGLGYRRQPVGACVRIWFDAGRGVSRLWAARRSGDDGVMRLGRRVLMMQQAKNAAGNG